MRAGLERVGIKTVFANDIDQTKANLYAANWGREELHVGDIRGLQRRRYPGRGPSYRVVSLYRYVACRALQRVKRRAIRTCIGFSANSR